MAGVTATSVGLADSATWNGDQTVEEYPLFFSDTTIGNPWSQLTYCQYTVISHDTALGEEGSPDPEDDVHRCFNCGSPDHILDACPEPRNPQLISLSRQMFQFYRGDSGLPRLRIHEVAEWTQQRVEWLQTFEPGRIVGPLLREALGISTSDESGDRHPWLKNMALWGYPKGWIAEEDPRQKVLKIIVGDDEEEDEEMQPFFIHNGEEQLEELDLSRTAASNSSFVPSRSFACVDLDSDDGSSSTLSSSAPETRRWATYPNAYFSSNHLPVYDGFTLPPLGEQRRETPRDLLPKRAQERDPPWMCAPVELFDTHSDMSRIPPWRRPSAFSNIAWPFYEPPPPPPPSSNPPPLPPSSTPPPLPPASTPPPLPPLLPSTLPLPPPSDTNTLTITELSDSDMEVSESESDTE